MAGSIDRRVGSILWQNTSLALNNFRHFNRSATGGVQMLGFADFHIFVADQPFLILPRVAIKLIRGRLHFDPQGIEGKKDKVGEFFPTWRPSTIEARTVLTELLRNCPEIKEVLNQIESGSGNQSSRQEGSN